MALSLQQEQQNQEINWEQIPEGISDLELAKKLQEEEDRRASQFYQEQEQAAAQVQVRKQYYKIRSSILECINCIEISVLVHISAWVEYRNLPEYAIIVGVCMQIWQMQTCRYFKAGLTF